MNEIEKLIEKWNEELSLLEGRERRYAEAEHYIKAHEDRVRLRAVWEIIRDLKNLNGDTEKRGSKLFCADCGKMKEHQIFTDVNTGLVCKNQLCTNNLRS